ncbi:hypothetical protein BDZ97DRAFT_1761864 [Flammula alnicola]|nr:hypothetical protein BDZ97DRAFT_1761864 [Flammula alnicola]
MGKPWTTPEQKLWLENHIPQYLEEQKKDRTSRYLLTVNEEWFKKFPEERVLLFANEPGQPLSGEEAEQLSQAMEYRKKQILNWFSWAVRPRRSTTSSSQESSFVAAIQSNNYEKAPRRRAPQRTEVYQRLYPRKVKLEIQRELSLLEGPITASDRMRVQRQVASSMLSKETLAVIAQVDGQVTLWRENHRKEEKEAMAARKAAGTAVSHAPKEFQAAIDGLPGVLKKALTACADTTGWVFFLSAAGPTPIAGGEIYMQNYYFGPKSAAGNDFADSYLDFNKGFLQPFSAHVRNCFPSAVRQQRSLNDENDQSPGPSIASTDGHSVVIVDSGSSKVSNSSDSDTDDESGPDEPDEDLHGSNQPGSRSSIIDRNWNIEPVAVAEPEQGAAHLSSPPAPANVPLHDDGPRSSIIDRTWDIEPIAVAEPEQGAAHLSTPPAAASVPLHDDGPSSPIEHAFARMARHPSYASAQTSKTPVADDLANDYHHIDPELLLQSGPQPEDSVLLDANMAGFVYCPKSTHSTPAVASTPSIAYNSQVMDAAPSSSVPHPLSGNTVTVADIPSASGTNPAPPQPDAKNLPPPAPSQIDADYTIADARIGPDLASESATAQSTSPPDADDSATIQSTSASDTDDSPLADLTPAQKRARTIAAKKAAAAAAAADTDNKRAADDTGEDPSAKRQKSVGSSNENQRPRRTIRPPPRADQSPSKK